MTTVGVALQGEQGVEFESEGSTDTNRWWWKSVGGLPVRERFVGVRGLLNEDLSEVGEDAPVAGLVGVGQRAASGGLANAAVIELGAQGMQAGFDVAQTLAPSQLGENHDDELFVAGQFADSEVATIASNTLVEFVFGQAVQQLGENGAAFVSGHSN